MAEIETQSRSDAAARAALPADELAYRLEQQRIIADFGMEALRSRDTQAMLTRATALVAAGMRTSLAKVLCYRAESEDMLVIAGSGWKPGIVGEKTMSADESSPAGFAFQTGESVISNHLKDEDRFRTPDFMVEHGVKRAINILIEVHGKPYGVLEVDSTDPGKFAPADLSFMRGFASLVGVAIERHRAETKLTEAKEYQELLTREASHRVKNSLAMVSSLLSLQARDQDDRKVVAMLGDAQDRIGTIALAHDLLWKGKHVGIVNLSGMICELAQALGEHSPNHPIDCDIEEANVSADTAIPVGLIVNELVTNAIKYAYGEGGGAVTIEGRKRDGDFVIAISDKGNGLPEGFSIDDPQRTSLGIRLIRMLAKQIGGRIAFASGKTGTTATFAIPLPTR